MIKDLFSSYKNIDYNIMRPKCFLEKEMNYSRKAAKLVRSLSGYYNLERCDLCGYDKFDKIIEKNGINIVSCLECGLVFSESIPINIDDVYSGEQYLDETLETIEKNSEYRKERFGTERMEILLREKKSGCLLDVGCGSGWFLDLARKAYECEGIEVSDSLRDYLIKKGTRSYKNIEETRNKYDIITGFDLIEHVVSPTILLEKFHSILKPNGIVLLFTPNFKSVSFYKLGVKCSLLTPPAHLYYFDDRTIKMYAEKLGFKSVKVETKGLDIGDLYTFYLSKGDKVISNFLKNNQNWLQHSIDVAGFANHMRVILKK